MCIRDRLSSLAPHAGNEPVFIDIPAPNDAAIEVVRRLGFRPSFETARMYRSKAPDLPMDQTFGITTLELG